MRLGHLLREAVNHSLPQRLFRAVKPRNQCDIDACLPRDLAQAGGVIAETRKGPQRE